MITNNLPGARKEQIERRINHAREEYPLLWHDFCQQWRNWQGEDSLWLTYSANYLFCTNGIRWAMDPFHLSARLPEVSPPDYQADLAGLQMIVFTHAHSDHLDWNLVKALRTQPLQWVIPQHMLELIQAAVDIPEDNIIVPQNAVPVRLGSLSLLPFDGLHFPESGDGGVPETGYLVEFDHTRWLFPGDTRNYNAARLPLMPRLHGLTAHLWLGKAAAAMPDPPQVKAFAQFCKELRPRQVLITHLYELGRDENDQWNVQHFNQVMPHLLTYFDPSRVRYALMGDRIPLHYSSSINI